MDEKDCNIRKAAFVTKKNANQDSCKYKTSIGGQALIEGLMMIGPQKRALAVRKPSGEIVLEYLDNAKVWAIEKIPFLRGSVKLIRQMVLGIKAMFRSADLSEILEDEKTEPDKLPDTEEKAKKPSFTERYPNVFMGFTTLIALGAAILLFGLLPNGVAEIMRRIFQIPEKPGIGWQLGLNFIEGVVRIFVFVGYLYLTRQNKEIKRVWQYHGSEHKTIACYEAGKELTVENVRGFSRLHPRCGTSFMFLVMIVAMIVLSLTGWHSAAVNVVIRLLLLPVIAGISYEIIRWAGKSDSKLADLISRPGLALQNLTTAEPDDSMIEVAVTAMKAVIPDDQSDAW